MSDKPQGLEKETLVIGSEDGLVLTGNRMEAFEGRLMASIRRPFLLLGGLLFIFFVLLIAGGVLLSKMNDRVSNSEDILIQATSPKAQKQQQVIIDKLVDDLLDGVDCKDQLNLQRLVDRLADKGFEPLAGITVVEPVCKPQLVGK